MKLSSPLTPVPTDRGEGLGFETQLPIFLANSERILWYQNRFFEELALLLHTDHDDISIRSSSDRPACVYYCRMDTACLLRRESP